MANQNHAGIHWMSHSQTKTDPRYLHTEMAYFDKIATIPSRPGSGDESEHARRHYLHKPFGKL